MLSEDLHIPDQELLRAADGELRGRRDAQVHAHLAACWNCRARMAEMEASIVEFTRAHRQTLDAQLPPIGGPRAQLRAQLAALAARSKANAGWVPRFNSGTRAAAICVALLTAALIGGLLAQRFAARARSSVASLEHGALPERQLTPGATRSVNLSDVCSMPHEEVVRDVPAPMRERVLREYGIGNERAGEYEIDYLITPGLGGAEDIHNLWPESYTSGKWNARVKDALEEHLHGMVCAGDLDLSTAQRDIATDWIAAYKKYFRSDRPLSVHSRGNAAALLFLGEVIGNTPKGVNRAR